ncbi:MAG TPA: hypothetical protein VFE78_15390 [Gemmataceae bacterium]|nr:hypothetical protein [Gemmataceae bacterium]
MIEASDTVTEPRLVIPRALLARAKKLTAERRSVSQPVGASRWAPPVLAGLALAAALSAGGLCLARRKGRALVVVLVLVCAFGAGRAFLCAGPPPNLTAAEVVFDHAAVEVVERGTEVRLLVPRTRLGELARGLRERK